MNQHKLFGRVLGALAVVFLAVGGGRAKDYEMLGGDARRSGATDERLLMDDASLAPCWSMPYLEFAAPITSTPLVVDGLVYVGCRDGSFHAVRASDGTVVRSWVLSGTISATPVWHRGRLYVGTQGGYLYGLAAPAATAAPGTAGTWEWRIVHGGRQLSSPVVAGDLVVFSRGEPFTDVRAYRLSDQTLVWSYDTGQITYATPTYANGYVFTASDNGRLFVLDAEDGTEAVAPYQTAGAVFTTSPVVRTDVEGDPNTYHLYFHPGDSDPRFYVLEWVVGAPALNALYSSPPGTVTGQALIRKQERRDAALRVGEAPAIEVDDVINVLAADLQGRAVLAEGLTVEERSAELRAWESDHDQIPEPLRAQVLAAVAARAQPAPAAGTGAGTQGSALSTAKVGGFSANGLSRTASPAYYYDETFARWEVLATAVQLGWGGPQLDVARMRATDTFNTEWTRYGAPGVLDGIHVPAPMLAPYGDGTSYAGLFAVGEELHVYHLASDQNLAIRPVTGRIRGTPVFANGRVFVGTDVGGSPARGRLYAWGTQNSAPGVPQLAPGSPRDGENVLSATPTLSWTAAPDAEDAPGTITYTLWLQIDALELQFDVAPGTTAYTLPSPVPADSALAYQVRAKDPQGAWSAWSETGEFFVQRDTIPPEPVTNLQAVPGGDSLAVSFAPSPSSDVAGYDLAWEAVGAPTGSWQSIGAVTSSVITGLTVNTQYTVRVRAVDRRGNVSIETSYLALTAPDDVTGPTVVSAALLDPDRTGRVALVLVRFNEAVRDSTFQGGAGFLLDGVAPTGIATGAVANDEQIELSWAAGPTGTGRRDLTYTPAVGGLRDLMGNAVQALGAAAGVEIDAAAPVLLAAVARENAVVRTGIDDDDTVTLTFSEPMAPATLTANNLDDVLALSSGHTWRDGAGGIGAATWSADGAVLTVRLSAQGGAPTLQVGDLITPANGVLVDRAAPANLAANAAALTGLFSADTTPPERRSLVTIDTDGDGRVDALQIVTSKSMDDATLAPAGFRIGAAAADGRFTGTPDDTIMVVTIAAGDPGTGPKSVAYTAATGGWRDLSGNALAAFSGVTAEDRAAPVVLTFAFFDDDRNGFLDRLVFTFSEPPASAGLDVADWIVTDGDGHTDLLAGLPATAWSLQGDTLTVRLANDRGTALTPNWVYADNGNGLRLADPAGNPLSSARNGTRPIADAGDDQTVPPGLVMLSAAGSRDADGDVLTARWLQVAGPAVVLSDATDGTPSFLARAAGNYLFQLTVSDGLFFSLPDTVLVRVLNVAPTAAAADGRVLKDLDDDLDVRLDARDSTDANSTPERADLVLYRFFQDGTPSPTAPVLLIVQDDPTRGVAYFDSSAAEAGVYQFVVEVTDRGGLTAQAAFRIVIDAAENHVPVAHAGVDREVEAGPTPVVLNGRQSHDADAGDVLRYSWRRLGGPDVRLEGADTATPSFAALEAGVYTFELLVNDDRAWSLPDTVTVVALPPAVAAPVAVLTAPASARIGETVTLSALDSTVPAAAVETAYVWEQTAGTAVPLSSVSDPRVTCVPVQPGTYRFRVTVRVKVTSGAILKDMVEAAVLVDGDGNRVPITRATSPASGVVGTRLTLDAAASEDPDGQSLTFRWVQTAGPAAALNDPTVARPSFTPGAVGIYRFQVEAGDGQSFGAPVEVLVAVNPAEATGGGLPTAAITAITDPVRVGDRVTLSGAGSASAAAGAEAPLAARWRQLRGPAVALEQRETLSPSFTAAAEGRYEFELIVEDEVFSSLPATVAFEVLPPADAESVPAPEPVVEVSARRPTPRDGGKPLTTPCFLVTASLSRGAGEGTVVVTNAAGCYRLAPDDAADLDAVRRFRDEFLMPTAAGRALVDGYYAAGPALAAPVGDHDLLRLASRHLAVRPVVAAAKLATTEPLAGRDAGGVALLAVYLLLGGWVLQRGGRGLWARLRRVRARDCS